jgi:hypothetical protein
MMGEVRMYPEHDVHGNRADALEREGPRIANGHAGSFQVRSAQAS